MTEDTAEPLLHCDQFALVRPVGSKVVCVRFMHDGRYRVTLRDPLGVGHESTVTGEADTLLAASQRASSCLLPVMASNRVAVAERAARFSRPLQVQNPRPDPTPRAAPRPSPAGSPADPAARPYASGSSAAPYTGSVPRNAEVFDPLGGGRFFVRLRYGLVWPDTHTTEDREFATLRLAKDVTRAAIVRPPQMELI